ncbi:MAG: MarR family winged helix-turn-helix transcriptional regulator [Aestuariivirga sp.]
MAKKKKSKEKSSKRDETPGGAAIVSAMERLSRLARAAEHEDGLNPAQWEALRYLSRANRLSNSPGALTRYLGATKGTISQTVIALERKGLVGKAVRENERRSVVLTLTEKGQEQLARDPWLKLAHAIEELGGKTRRRLGKGLATLLTQELQRGSHASFGSCPSCRFFRERGRDSEETGPHLCMLIDKPLSEAETAKICIEHQTAP